MIQVFWEFYEREVEISSRKQFRREDKVVIERKSFKDDPKFITLFAASFFNPQKE